MTKSTMPAKRVAVNLPTDPSVRRSSRKCRPFVNDAHPKCRQQAEPLQPDLNLDVHLNQGPDFQAVTCAINLILLSHSTNPPNPTQITLSALSKTISQIGFEWETNQGGKNHLDLYLVSGSLKVIKLLFDEMQIVDRPQFRFFVRWIRDFIESLEINLEESDLGTETEDDGE